MKTNFFWAIGFACLAVQSVQAHDDASHHSDHTATISNDYKELNTDQLRDLLKSNPKVVLMDVRSLDDGTRISGAKLVPSDSKDEIIIANFPDKNATIVVYCVSSECPASKSMAKRLAKMGYKNIYKYTDGIEGWEEKGNPVETVKSPESVKVETSKSTSE